MKNIVHFETLGCKLNQVESEGIAKNFTDSGFECTMTPLTAASAVDENVICCVVNTCTVTTKSEQKARRIIRLLLNKFPCSIVAVTGCYAQLAEKEILAIDPRICVLGGQMKGYMANLPSIIKESNLEEPLELSVFVQKKFEELKANKLNNVIFHPFKLETTTFINHSRSSLKIQDGCNCVCTYCAIRLARGKSVSLDAAEVVKRVQDLEKSGQKEVVITTVNIGQYVSKWEDKTINFAGLLKILLEKTSVIAFRISSLYPEIVDEEFARIISDKRVRPHFHISIQSGSDAILEKMKRPYKIEKVYNAVKFLRQAKGNPFLACDIIAGFPGETDEDFALTMKMLEDCNFTFVHAFPFSARPGTEAYSMRPMVPNSVAGQRVSCLEKFNLEHKGEYIRNLLGKTVSAVCETVHRRKIMQDKIVVHAVTENFIHCQLVFDKDENNIPQAGSEVPVKIIRPLEKSEVTGESEVLAECV